MPDLKKHTCCFTGHRDMPSDRKSDIRSQLKAAVERAIQNGYRFFGAGGALEFDTMAAQTVVKFKRQYPHIRLILMLPCRTQADGWKKIDVDEYERIKSLADEVIYTAEEYKKGLYAQEKSLSGRSLQFVYLLYDKKIGRNSLHC